MIRITSESQLLEAFRPRERAEVELPKEFRYPLAVTDYLAWTEPSGHRIYLVFVDPDREGAPFGIVFRRDSAGGSAVPGMCEWCHSVRSGGGVGLLSAEASSRRRIGISLCNDLSCKEKASDSPGVDDMPQTEESAQARIRKITRRMAVFSRKNLF